MKATKDSYQTRAKKLRKTAIALKKQQERQILEVFEMYQEFFAENNLVGKVIRSEAPDFSEPLYIYPRIDRNKKMVVIVCIPVNYDNVNAHEKLAVFAMPDDYEEVMKRVKEEYIPLIEVNAKQ